MDKPKKDKDKKKGAQPPPPQPTNQPPPPDRSKVVWGVSIEEAAKKSPQGFVPAPIQFAYDYLTSNEKFLQEEGIFRIPGSVSDVNEARAMFDKGLIPTFPVWREKEATSILVNFLNHATDSAFGSYRLDQEFQVANEKGDVRKTTQLLLQLPLANRETLRLIAILFKRISDYSDINKMTLSNLSISFGGSYVTCFPLMVQHCYTIFPNTILFGLDLEEASRRSGGGIPYPLISCMQCINKYGMDEDMIYQEGGEHTKIREFIYQFNSGNKVTFGPQDVHCCTSIIMSFFRDSKSSLWGPSKDLKQNLINVKDLASSDDQIVALTKLIPQLPKLNATVVCTWGLHLAHICESPKNKMKPLSLANCLGRNFSKIFLPIIIHIFNPKLQDALKQFLVEI